MTQWLNLTDEQRRNTIAIVAEQESLSSNAVEKDWWVTLVLRAIFSTPYKNSFIFKGGTSLSKGWALIQRLSEDIDLALDRTVIGDGYGAGKLSVRMLERLRNESIAFVAGDFKHALEGSLAALGLSATRYRIAQDDVDHSDPNLLVEYDSLYAPLQYLPPRVKIEISTRSLREPFSNRPVRSFIGTSFPDEEFAEQPTDIPTVEPKRTFLEKAFLLHEEFLKHPENIRVYRMSRHLYDLEKIENHHEAFTLGEIAYSRAVGAML